MAWWNPFKKDKEYIFTKMNKSYFDFIDIEKEDRNIWTCSGKFIEDVIFPFCKSNQMYGYVGEAGGKAGWDCNKLSLEMKYWASVKAWGDYGMNIPFGIAKFKRDDGVWHSICFVVTTDRGLLYIEPATCKFLRLSDSEYQSIRYRRLM